MGDGTRSNPEEGRTLDQNTELVYTHNREEFVSYDLIKISIKPTFFRNGRVDQM